MTLATRGSRRALRHVLSSWRARTISAPLPAVHDRVAAPWVFQVQWGSRDMTRGNRPELAKSVADQTLFPVQRVATDYSAALQGDNGPHQAGRPVFAAEQGGRILQIVAGQRSFLPLLSPFGVTNMDLLASFWMAATAGCLIMRSTEIA